MSIEYRGYTIEHEGRYNQKVIKPVGRGALPNALKGAYTSFEFAKRAINIVVDEREPKEAPAVA